MFASSLYRGRGPPNTDMKDGNESGKDAWLVCTGIVREVDTVKKGSSFQSGSQSRARMAFGIEDTLATCANGVSMGKGVSFGSRAAEMQGFETNDPIMQITRGKASTRCTMSRRSGNQWEPV